METWTHIQNPFLIATKNSFVGAMALSRWHEGALSNEKADPDIMIMFNDFHPKHVAYMDIYDKWKTTLSDQQSRTLNIDQLFRELAGEKIGRWDVIVQSVYANSTAEYKRLLPHRRIPFQHGKQELRLEAVKSLSTNIGADPALATLKTDVDAFYTLLSDALSGQKGLRAGTKSMSVELEAARVAMCKAMFASLGSLIKKYTENPDKINHFFDLETIRDSQQTFFTGTIKPLELTSVMRRTFNAGDEVVLTNLTNATLKFYLAKLKGDLPGTKFVELPKGEQTITAEQLGNLTDPFLMVMNTNGDIIGRYEIEIV